ncbi:hypothetical protein RUM44_013156 [Polyplax serrata]|uniref:Nose resistant-to-fluoxetine protein N-terminal domain-containing protein n=1 Tax=Polyplax serrata TaxID=468196 RepID=A0ABR1BDC8_POLSC
MKKKVLFVVLLAILPGKKCADLGVFGVKAHSGKDLAECLGDTSKVVDAVGKKEFWALKILDASSKFPSGVLTGHLTDYGHYDECLDTEGFMKTQHCFVNFHVDAGNITLPPLKLAYCIPASCPVQFLQDAFQDLANNLNVTFLNVTVGEDDCSGKLPKTLTQNDYVGISIWGFFLGLAILSTICDAICRMRNVETGSLFSSFSIRQNGARLLTMKTNSKHMAPIHGLRFLSICWVILGHRCFFTASPSLLNLTDLVEELTKLYVQLFVQGILAVDTFFLIGGLLNSYHLMDVLDKTGKFPLFKYYVHRYIRLTPALAAIVLMYATWYVLIGDGPNWISMTKPWKELCVSHWWTTLLYINNYYNPTSQCAGHSWYLAVDMQLYWVAPLIILPLWKWPKFGKIGLWLLLVASTVVVFLIAYIYEFRAPFSAGFDGIDEFLRTTKMIYVPTHTRASPYIIGILVGYYLHNLKKAKTKFVISKVGPSKREPVEEHPYNRIESSLYISLHRVGWSFAMSWIIICCVHNKGGIVSDILSWKAFVPLSRLTYAIFLSHMAIQQYQIGTARTPDYFQYFNQIHRFFGDLIFSIVVATFLTLTFESPVLFIEKLFRQKSQVRQIGNGEVNKGFQDETVDVNTPGNTVRPDYS